MFNESKFADFRMKRREGAYDSWIFRVFMLSTNLSEGSSGTARHSIPPPPDSNLVQPDPVMRAKVFVLDSPIFMQKSSFHEVLYSLGTPCWPGLHREPEGTRQPAASFHQPWLFVNKWLAPPSGLQRGLTDVGR